MWQEILVAVIVLAAFGVSAWKLMPAQRRLAVLVAVDRWASRHAALAAWRARSLQPRIARAAGAGCAGCAANTEAHTSRAPR
jgi:hypothetical protein